MKGDQSNHTESRWQKTPVANLVRHVQSGNYYARIRVQGKLIWKSLKTDRISVAKLRLGDFHKGERQRAATHSAVARGKMAFAQALETYRERLNGDYSLKDRSKVYREERIAALLKSWPELEATDAAQVSKAGCLAWAARFGQKASPSAFNNTVGTLNRIAKRHFATRRRLNDFSSVIFPRKLPKRSFATASRSVFNDFQINLPFNRTLA